MITIFVHPYIKSQFLAVYNAINTCDVSTDYGKSFSICIRVHKEERRRAGERPGSQSAFKSATEGKTHTKEKGLKGKKKKISTVPSPRDTAVYLQRDRAR